jgi:hypothetical protein
VGVAGSVKVRLAKASADGEAVTVRVLTVGADAPEAGILEGWEKGPARKARMPTMTKARIIKGKLLKKERRLEVRARLRAFLQDRFWILLELVERPTRNVFLDGITS